MIGPPYQWIRPCPSSRLRPTNHAIYLAPGSLESGQRDGLSADGVKRKFSILSPQSMQIGSLNIQHVFFATPADSGENAVTSKEDGLLAMVVFRRVFIGDWWTDGASTFYRCTSTPRRFSFEPQHSSVFRKGSVPSARLLSLTASNQRALRGVALSLRSR